MEVRGLGLLCAFCRRPESVEDLRREQRVTCSGTGHAPSSVTSADVAREAGRCPACGTTIGGVVVEHDCPGGHWHAKPASGGEATAEGDGVRVVDGVSAYGSPTWVVEVLGMVVTDEIDDRKEADDIADAFREAIRKRVLSERRRARMVVVAEVQAIIADVRERSGDSERLGDVERDVCALAAGDEVKG